MERIHTRLPLFLPLPAAVGFGLSFLADGIAIWVIGLVGIVSLVPMGYAMRRWVGNSGTAMLLAAAFLASAFAAAALPTTHIISKLVLLSLLPGVVFGGYAVAMHCFQRVVPRVTAATAVMLAVSTFVVNLVSGSMPGGVFVSMPLVIWLGVAAVFYVAFCEVYFRSRPPILPVPAELTLGLIAIGTVGGGVAIAAVDIPAILFSVLLVGGTSLPYRRIYYDFRDMIVFVDEAGEAIATGAKLLSHNSETRLHRAFSVFLFNEKGDVLLQQRAFSKKTWPGVWSNSCCGHVMLHESTAAAAKRRLAYELGIGKVDLKVILPEFRYRAEKDGIVENEVCPVLVGFIDAEPKPRPSEVAATRWQPWTEFVATVNDPASGLSPWAVEEVKLLAENEVFKAEYATRTNTSGAEGIEGSIPLRDAA